MEDLYNSIIQQLASANIPSPRLEARLLMAHVLNCNPSEIYTGVVVSLSQKQQIEHLLRRRLAHCPLDKIIGKREFYKSEFICNENVLSPRPDTEILVEEAIRILSRQPTSNILDLGTGSGCIILSLLKEFPQTHGVAVDISEKALEVAKANSKSLHLETQIKFYLGSWFADDFCAQIGAEFNLIVSNPPYIASSEIADLAPEVKKYDPMLALDGGKSGFDSYIRIAEIAPKLLADNGYILLEAGKGQAPKIGEIFAQNGLKLCAIIPDLAGIERCVILQKAVA